MSQPKLYLALDTSTRGEAIEKARRVHDVPGDYGFKLNLDEIILCGSDPCRFVDAFVETFGRPIFTDLKMWNGGRTMSALAFGLANAGSSLINVYAHSGVKFMSRIKEAVAKTSMEVYGLGALTHYTNADCMELYRRPLSDATLFFARRAKRAGLDGYIQAGTVLGTTSRVDIKKLVPAVRPVWYADTKANEQEQTVTPETAFERGASTIVIGSPVFKSPDPAEALDRLMRSIPR